jgi:hypothetical protein
VGASLLPQFSFEVAAFPQRRFFNAKEAPFLARGDGDHDDAPAIQAALDAAAEAGGGTVYLPPGVYPLRSVQEERGIRYFLLNYHSGVTLAGAGRERTILRAGANLPDETRILSSAATNGRSIVRHAAFYDFAIDGNAAQQADARSMSGISNIHTVDVHHARLLVHDVKGTPEGEGSCYGSYNSAGDQYVDCEAGRFGPGSTGSGFGATFSSGIAYRNCLAWGSTHWMGLTAYRSTQVSYVGCHGFGNGQRGLNCEQSEEVVYDSCTAGGDGTQGNRGDGFYLFHSARVRLLSCISQGNQNGLVNLSSTAVRVVGGAFQGNARAGLCIVYPEDSGTVELDGDPILDANGTAPVFVGDTAYSGLPS